MTQKENNKSIWCMLNNIIIIIMHTSDHCTVQTNHKSNVGSKRNENIVKLLLAIKYAAKKRNIDLCDVM